MTTLVVKSRYSYWYILQLLLLFLSGCISGEDRLKAAGVLDFEQAGNSCPSGNTCCPLANNHTGCIPSDMGSYNATCCSDQINTGCPVNYTCQENFTCVATSYATNSDKLVERLPRYYLCEFQERGKGGVYIAQVHGFPIEEQGQQGPSFLAYYSSHGPFMENLSTNDRSSYIFNDIDFIFIVIHGANRNADDYFCAATKATELQQHYSNVLVIAPRFLSNSDSISNSSFLVWEGDEDGDGPWRYGAESIHLTFHSSFTCLDSLVKFLLEKTSVNIVIAGHSSGGQMVQRWSLLTHVWDEHRMSSVVANPSSYAYLTPLRLIDDQWSHPFIEDCPLYNKWEWGLESGGEMDVPYKTHAYKNISKMTKRFQRRHVTYLTGSLDKCNISSTTPEGWCHSHGLETSCMDTLQGMNRLQRSYWYMESLDRIDIGFRQNHLHMIVDGVGHDHTLMFQSLVGIEALFGWGCKIKWQESWEENILQNQ